MKLGKIVIFETFTLSVEPKIGEQIIKRMEFYKEIQLQPKIKIVNHVKGQTLHTIEFESNVEGVVITASDIFALGYYSAKF